MELTNVKNTFLQLEDAVEKLRSHLAIAPHDTGTLQSATATSEKEPLGGDSWNEHVRDTATESRQPYHNLTAPHKIFIWPAIFKHLSGRGLQEATDMHEMKREGTPWLLRKEIAKHPRPLPRSLDLSKQRVNGEARAFGHSEYFVFPTLDLRRVQGYTDAYFRTFNVLTPILDENLFFDLVMRRLVHIGYAEDDQSLVLAFTVLALGSVAIEGALEPIAEGSGGLHSGWRGGSMENPPGLEFFNEARRRMGFATSFCTLSTVQTLLLHATYYGTCARHLEYWRCMEEASLACQSLIHCRQIDWSSYEGDMILRVYWACMSNESFFHRDLDMPRSRIELMQDWMPLPVFRTQSGEGDQRTLSTQIEEPHQEHFLAIISLSRLTSRVDELLHQAASSNNVLLEAHAGPTNLVLYELARQLTSWRSALPVQLQWIDSEIYDMFHLDQAAQRVDRQAGVTDVELSFLAGSTELSGMHAQLRSRYYCLRFQILRPYLFKALHFSSLMTASDMTNCGLAIQAACFLSLVLMTMRSKKRHVPHHFTWTQSAASVLAVLNMVEENQTLQRASTEFVDAILLKHTEACMLEWIRDMRVADGVAEWSHALLKP